MNNFYTYEVDHGNESPSVGVGSEVNGGKVTAVSFTAQLESNNKAREIIEDMLDNDFLERATFDKLIDIQNLI